MTDYLVVKWLHVLSSTVLFGTGIGSAFYLLFTSLARDVAATARVTRLVVTADSVFTTPTALLQPLTGFWLVALLGGTPAEALDVPWLRLSIGLYALAIAAWVPVVVIQVRMRNVAAQAHRDGTALPRRYFQLLAAWIVLGWIAFFAFVAIFWLMVTGRA